MKESELSKETYRILNTLVEEKSFRLAKERLPGLTDRQIWEAISIAASMVKPFAGVEKRRNLKVYVDGAAEPNPGPAGVGIVIYDEKEKIANINAEIFKRYQRIREKKDGVAVVPVADGFCGGCSIALPPQLINDVLKGEDLVACRNCLRILYLKEKNEGS